MALEFNAEGHAYRDGARVYPHITGVLHATGVMTLDPAIPPLVLEKARDRGSKVHLAIRYANEGRLDATSLAAQIEPYLFGWESFCSQHMGDFEPLIVEEPMADPTLGFAGTPDAIGMKRGVLTVIEVKTCAVMPPGTAIQTAAQRVLARANGHRVVQRFGVQLRPDGTFRLHEYRDVNDEVEWKSALFLYQRRWARERRTPDAA